MKFTTVNNIILSENKSINVLSKFGSIDYDTKFDLVDEIEINYGFGQSPFPVLTLFKTGNLIRSYELRFLQKVNEGYILGFQRDDEFHTVKIIIGFWNKLLYKLLNVLDKYLPKFNEN